MAPLDRKEQNRSWATRSTNYWLAVDLPSPERGNEDLMGPSLQWKRPSALRRRAVPLRRHGYSVLEQTVKSDGNAMRELNEAMSVSTVDIASRKIHALAVLWNSLSQYTNQLSPGTLVERLLETPSGRPGQHYGSPSPTDTVSSASSPSIASRDGQAYTRQMNTSPSSPRSPNHGRRVRVSGEASQQRVYEDGFRAAGPPPNAFPRLHFGADKGSIGSDQTNTEAEELSSVRIPASNGVERRHHAAHGGVGQGTPTHDIVAGLTLTALISERNLWWAGVICAAVAALAGGLGDCVLRYSFVKEIQREKSNREWRPDAGGRPLHMRPLWILGMFLSVIINPFLTLVAYRFTAVSVAAMFGGLHALGSLIFSQMLLSERIGWRDVLGGFLIVGGITVVVVFGQNVGSGKELVINSVAFIVFTAVTAVAIAITAAVSHRRLLSAKLSEGAVAVSTALLPGLTGGLTNVCGKGAVVLWTDAFRLPAIWSLPYTWIFAALAVLAALAQVVFLSVSLSRYPASYIAPVYNAVLISMNSLGGIWIFQEKTNSLSFYLLGLLCIFAGIWLTSHSQHRKGSRFSFTARRRFSSPGGEKRRRRSRRGGAG
ncbi:magnesium transporter nipa [Cystoisospora suis]|uniref:Magnesium transporter nipa n=1 Tax=Cystoisospora suis TaxID=483139 RepID=A0A2C6KVY7_9APIC|nr:magnesium transporter nipa [Cystoisospora suis]